MQQMGPGSPTGVGKTPYLFLLAQVVLSQGRSQRHEERIQDSSPQPERSARKPGLGGDKRQQSVHLETRCLDVVCRRLQASSAAHYTMSLRSLNWLGSSRDLHTEASMFCALWSLSRGSASKPGPHLSPHWNMFDGAGLTERFSPLCQGLCLLFMHLCLSLHYPHPSGL